jgi:hypothetical protein
LNIGAIKIIFQELQTAKGRVMSRLAVSIFMFSVLIAALITPACYLTEPEGTTLSIRIDASAYLPEEGMKVTFENDSGRRYLLQSSGCITLDEKPLPRLTYERRENGRWIDAGGPACPRIFVSPVELRLRESYSVTFRAYVSAMEFVPGMYRIRFYFADDDGRPVPPDDQQYSETFLLRKK